jgi:hypothetical protein
VCQSNEKKESCQKPQNLKGKPEDCSPKQIRECHGGVEEHPCVAAGACEHPEKLKGKPEDCPPEQIRECHGDVREHPCVPR